MLQATLRVQAPASGQLQATLQVQRMAISAPGGGAGTGVECPAVKVVASLSASGCVGAAMQLMLLLVCAGGCGHGVAVGPYCRAWLLLATGACPIVQPAAARRADLPSTVLTQQPKMIGIK